jgi:hypothetical protein
MAVTAETSTAEDLVPRTKRDRDIGLDCCNSAEGMQYERKID